MMINTYARKLRKCIQVIGKGNVSVIPRLCSLGPDTLLEYRFVDSI